MSIPAISPEPKPQPARVLVVDHTPANLSLLLDALSEVGYELLVAGNGRSALSLLDHPTPDLVLMDLVMPGMATAPTALC